MVETSVAPPDSGAVFRRYFSRELSLLAFHERVLDQARPGMHPLLERVKFLAISDANLDEFLSIHFSLLLGHVELGGTALTPDGYTQVEQLRRVREALLLFMREQRRIFHEELVPELAAKGIVFQSCADLTSSEREALRIWFLREVFPVCTPLAVDPAHPFPFISNLSLNIGVMLADAREGRSFVRIKVPNVLPRLVRVPGQATDNRRVAFVWLEDVLGHNLDAFFPGVNVHDVFVFRVVRDADLELQAIEATDLRELVKAGVRRRRFGETVCVQLERALPGPIGDELMARLDVYPEDMPIVGAPLGLSDLFQLLSSTARTSATQRSAAATRGRRHWHGYPTRFAAATSCCITRTIRSRPSSTSSPGPQQIQTYWPSSRRCIGSAVTHPW